MDDERIVDLFFERDEYALFAVTQKYGRYCYAIAFNILHNKEDADESVNDTYMSAWKRIPPHRPMVLSTFLGKITRRISFNKWRYSTREKRGGGELQLALDELSEVLSSSENVEKDCEKYELSKSIGEFLFALPQTERDVFISRYWFVADIKEISQKFEFSESKTKSMLFRTREKLKKHLIQEGLI